VHLRDIGYYGYYSEGCVPNGRTAFGYIRTIESYGKARVSGLSTHQASEFITRSHVAKKTPHLLSQKDKMFRIEGKAIPRI